MSRLTSKLVGLMLLAVLFVFALRWMVDAVRPFLPVLMIGAVVVVAVGVLIVVLRVLFITRRRHW